MNRYLAGLHQHLEASAIPDGYYLVRIQRAQHFWDWKKSTYAIQFTIVEPNEVAGRSIFARLCCTKRSLWKLSWFLTDFGYDPELLDKDELDESALLTLQGIVKISNTVVNGISVLNLDGFAPAARWTDFSTSTQNRVEVAS